MKGKLPRLAPNFYRGSAYVFWTHTTEQRIRFPLTDIFHSRFREILAHCCARYHLAIPVYCIMPDHLHLLAIGLSEDSDQRKATAYFRKHLSPLIAPAVWQRQAHDHVVREDERANGIFADSVDYILENPVRAGLVDGWKQYSYTGCLLVGFPCLERRDSKFNDVFWKSVNGQNFTVSAT